MSPSALPYAHVSTGRPRRRLAGPPRRRCASLLAALALLAAGSNTALAQVGEAPPHPAPAGPGSQQEQAAAEASPPAEEAVRAISLPAAVQRAVANNPLTRAVRLDVQRRQLDVEQVENFWSNSSFQLNSLSGVVPAARGDIFQSVDTANDINNFGPFYRLDVTAALPLYTFGRLRNAANAARAAVNAEQGQADRTRDELTREVVGAYWGLVAARQSLELAREMGDSYQELLDEVDEKLADNAIDPNDAYEVRAARFDIESVRLDVIENHRVLQGALAELLGEDPSTPYQPTEEAPPAVELGREDLDRLQAIAMRLHPQLRALESAVGALEAGMDVAKANRWPVFLVGATFGIAQSPNRDDQDNPFVYDEFNYRRLGAALNIRWDLNFARHRIDLMKRKVERDATDARRQALQMRVSIEVQRALERVLKNIELVASAEQTRRTTRRWLRTSFDDFDLGIGEAQPLIRAYRADYRLQGLIIETQYELNVSLAELAFALGDFHTYVRWIADGRVALD